MPSSAFKNLPPGTTISRSPGKITIIRRPMNPAPAAPLLPKRVVYVSKRRFAAKKTPTTPLPPQRVPTVGPTSPLIAPDLSPFWQPHLKIIKRKGDRRFQEFLQLLRDERDNWNAPTTNSSATSTSSSFTCTTRSSVRADRARVQARDEWIEQIIAGHNAAALAQAAPRPKRDASIASSTTWMSTPRSSECTEGSTPSWLRVPSELCEDLSLINKKLAIEEAIEKQQDVAEAASLGMTYDELKRLQYDEKVAKARVEEAWYCANPGNPGPPPPPEGQDPSEDSDLKRMIGLCCDSSSELSRMTPSPSSTLPPEQPAPTKQPSEASTESSWASLEGSGLEPTASKQASEDSAESSWASLLGSGRSVVLPIDDESRLPTGDLSQEINRIDDEIRRISSEPLPESYGPPPGISLSDVAFRQDFSTPAPDPESESDQAPTVDYELWEQKLAAWRAKTRKEQQEPDQETEEQQQHGTSIFGKIKSWASNLWQGAVRVYHNIWDD